jgi:hypothetical protein
LIRSFKQAGGGAIFWSILLVLFWIFVQSFVTDVAPGEIPNLLEAYPSLLLHLGSCLLLIVQLVYLLNTMYSVGVLEDKTYTPLIFVPLFILAMPMENILLLAVSNGFWIFFFRIIIQLDDHSGKRMDTYLFSSLIFTVSVILTPDILWFLPFILIGLRLFGYLDVNRLFAFLSFSLLLLFIYGSTVFMIGGLQSLQEVLDKWFYWRMNLEAPQNNLFLLLLLTKGVFWLLLSPQLFAAQPNSSVLQRRFFTYVFLIISFGTLLAILNTKNIVPIFALVGLPMTLHMGLSLDKIGNAKWSLGVVVLCYIALFGVRYVHYFGVPW